MNSASYVLCHPHSKRPIGKNWAKSGVSWDVVMDRRAADPTLNVGLLLGAQSGIVDVECDSANAQVELRELIAPDILRQSPSWESKRGAHYLFGYDDRLAPVPSVKKIGDIEFRIGNGKAIQSIIPPSVVDGVERKWTVPLSDNALPKLPEHVIGLLLADATSSMAKQTDVDDFLFGDINLARQRQKLDRIQEYCKVHDLQIERVEKKSNGSIFLHLNSCPFKSKSHSDGDPCLIVNTDGSHCFHCLHAKCTGKKWAEVEAKFGSLLPSILTSPDYDRVTKVAIRALGCVPNVYQRANTLFEITHDAPKPELCLSDNGAPRLRPIPKASLTVSMASSARWETIKVSKKDGTSKRVHCAPPKPIVDAVHSAASFPGIPVIAGIVSAPVLRSDGSLLISPGYDAQTGLYADLIEEYPGLMSVSEALETIHDVLCDFPFVGPEHYSGCVAMLISMLTRHAFSGPSPFFLVDSNASRVGKGLMTDLATMIAEGREAARFTPQSSDEETRKQITTAALSGASYILFDNIKGKLGGPALENAMTTGFWNDRILGTNREVSLRMALTWLGTSNNATMTNDMVGRTCHIRLETKLENPSQRSGFRHDDLLAYAKANRKKLAIAVLSIPARFIETGRPNQNLPTWGGFQGWSGLVRESIVWAGLTDPGLARSKLAEQADDEKEEFRELIDAWKVFKLPTTVSEALKIIEDESDVQYDGLRGIVQAFPKNPNRALGNLLKAARERVVDGRKICRNDKDPPRWFVTAA